MSFTQTNGDLIFQRGTSGRGALIVAAVAVSILQFMGAASGQVFDERFDDWPSSTSIRGTVCFATELDDVTVIGKELSRQRIDADVTVLCGTPAEQKTMATVFPDSEAQYLDDRLLLTDEQTKLLTEIFAGDNVVCWLRMHELTSNQRAALLGKRSLLQAFIHRGGTLICVGSMSDLMGKFSIVRDDSAVEAGLDLVPDTMLANVGVTDQRLLLELQRYRRTVGLRLTAQALVVLNRRTIRVAGAGRVTFVLPDSEFHEARSRTLSAVSSEPQRPNEYLVDLTQWRREAIERTLELFPAVRPGAPQIANGTLMIVGGGVTPEGLMERFIELAGGLELAKLVYVPCSEADRISKVPYMVDLWKKMGVQHVTWIHTKDRQTANSDEAFLKPLSDATGIWFGGGRQWNLADSYYGTSAHRLMKEVLHRGGVIGGSSAGASIQARYLARATPIENLEIMAPGYERGGLGFLNGVAIDQHFSQRNRQPDMTRLKERYPQLLGIGIDEQTAVIVQESQAEIVGKGRVWFYDQTASEQQHSQDYLSLPAGSAYDLVARKILRDTRETQNESDVENR